MQQYFLCTDLDRTLIPNGAEPESPSARQMFNRLVCETPALIAYATGRHRALIEQAIEQYSLPQPNFAIADVGSTIYKIEQGVWQQVSEWEEKIRIDWEGRQALNLHALLKDITVLKLQEPEKQNRYKLSYYLSLDIDEKQIMEELKKRLMKIGIQANLIWSIDDTQANVGLLDILPASANKLHAIHFLMKQYNFNYDNTVFAGDSGNDLDVLLSPIPAVLVANANDKIRTMAARTNMRDRFYQAKGNYLSMNGNYSAGILEGVAHFLPYVDNWLRFNNGR